MNISVYLSCLFKKKRCFAELSSASQRLRWNSLRLLTDHSFYVIYFTAFSRNLRSMVAACARFASSCGASV